MRNQQTLIISFHDGRPVAAGLDAAALGFAAFALVAAGFEAAFLVAGARLGEAAAAGAETEEDIVLDGVK
jgi:hypothetical protein